MTCFRKEVEALDRAKLLRAPRAAPPGLLDLSSNSYLGLARHPRLVAAAKEAIDRYGTGAGASRLVSGDSSLLRELEERLRNMKGTEAALVSPTGYAAAWAGISTTVGPGDTVLVEKKSHASLVDAARLAKARFGVFRNEDPEGAARAIRRARKKGARRVLLVADGVASMDGAIFPLPDYLPILDEDEDDVFLFLDDAHATGVLGPRGEGSLAHFGIPPHPRILQMGTLSKALASQGGFLAGPADWIRLVASRGRSVVFTTALAPAMAAAASAALDLLAAEPEILARLRARTAELRAAVAASGRDVGGDPSVPILPVILGSIEAAFAAESALTESGFYAPAIRPPTVPEGTSRLRLSASAGHPEGAYAGLTRALASSGPARGSSRAGARSRGGAARRGR